MFGSPILGKTPNKPCNLQVMHPAPRDVHCAMIWVRCVEDQSRARQGEAGGCFYVSMFTTHSCQPNSQSLHIPSRQSEDLLNQYKGLEN